MRISDLCSDVCSSERDTALAAPPPEPAGLSEASTVAEADAHDPANLRALQREARAMAATATLSESGSRRWSHAADKVTLHPVIGPILLAAIMFVMFQAVFAWAERPMALIEAPIGPLQPRNAQVTPAGFRDGRRPGRGRGVLYGRM